MDFDQSVTARELRLVFAVSCINVYFLVPARMDDALMITLTLAKRGGASLQLLTTDPAIVRLKRC